MPHDHHSFTGIGTKGRFVETASLSDVLRFLNDKLKREMEDLLFLFDRRFGRIYVRRLKDHNVPGMVEGHFLDVIIEPDQKPESDHALP